MAAPVADHGAVEPAVAVHETEHGQLVLTAGEDPGGEPHRDPVVIRPSRAWRRLHLVDVGTGAAARSGPPDRHVWELDWDGEGCAAAVLSDVASENAWYGARIGLVDLRSGAVRDLHVPQWQLACPRLSPSGAHVAFVEGLGTDRGSVAGTARVVGVDGGAARDVAPELDVTWLAWRDEATLWFAGQRGLRSMCGYAGLDGTVEELWSGNAVLRGVAAQPARRGLVAVRESADEPPEVAVLDAGSGARWRPLTALNRGLRDHDLPPGATGLAVRRRPGDRGAGRAPARRPAGPLPLVVVVHGGPAARWAYGFPAGARHVPMLAHAGYAVLLPNPRGSTGRGQGFARAVIGDLGGGELRDVLAGVDACVAAGIADPRRLAIMGASHGGFLAAWAVTRTRRFRAAVALACLSDYLSCHHTSEIGALDEILFAGAGPAAWVERSPVTHARACTTPTLILHGAQDPVCPPGQARELYQALVEAGAETELVVYPREATAGGSATTSSTSAAGSWRGSTATYPGLSWTGTVAKIGR